MSASTSISLCRAIFLTVAILNGVGFAAAGDKDQLEACLKKSDSKLSAYMACVDFLKCHDEAGCTHRELGAWESRVDIAVKRVKQSAPETTTPLANAQGRWAASLAKLCPLFENRDPGVGLSDAFCRSREAAMRAFVLEQLSYAVGEH